MVPDRYEDAGVRPQSEALSAVARHLGPTLSFSDRGQVLTSFGHYAAVVRIADDAALAICTDGVGTKTVVAAALDRYDTIGFDCMAMNVNDLVCVGARPLALVDYLGVHTLDDRRVDQVLEGLGQAAKEAGVSVPGGELAQLPDVIGSDGRGSGDERAFDLVGTAVGIVRPDEIILGRDVAPGDAVIGCASSGLHSNGFTLARKALSAAGYSLTDHVEELGCTLGEELLRPTEIYVRAVLGLWNEGIRTKGLAHITGDGLLNVCRLEAEVGYRLDSLFDPPAIFDLIAEAGNVPEAEMFEVFNMGTGFVIVVDARDETTALESLHAHGQRAQRIGEVTADTGRVEIVAHGLVGTAGDGFRSD